MAFLSTPSAFPAVMGFKDGKLRSLAIPTTTTVNNAPTLVGFPSNVASESIAPTIVTNDVAKNIMFLYDAIAGDVNNISAYKRGIEFTSSTPAAASIKNLLPNAISTYVAFVEPLAFPLGPGHTLLKGSVTAFIITQTEMHSTIGREYLDAMTGTEKGFVKWDSDTQIALLANKDALGSIMPTLPPGAEFAASNNISYASAPVDIKNAPMHRMALKNKWKLMSMP